MFGRTQKLYVRPPFILKSWTSGEPSFRICITDIILALHLTLGKFISFQFFFKQKSVPQKGSDVHLKLPTFDLFAKKKTNHLLNLFLSFYTPYIMTTWTVGNFNNFKFFIRYKIDFKLGLLKILKLSLGYHGNFNASPRRKKKVYEIISLSFINFNVLAFKWDLIW